MNAPAMAGLAAAAPAVRTSTTPTFAIAIPCHNEAQNIQTLLTVLDTGWHNGCRPSRIVVFSSACRDGTDSLVARFARTSRIRVQLATETQQRGKCHAVNQLMEMAGNVSVIVLVGADVLVTSQDIAALVQQFQLPHVGAAGGRPVPARLVCHMSFRVSKVMWDVHHLMAQMAPKTTEVSAFRNLGFRLDESTLVDEAEIEQHIRQRGYTICYCPEVTIHHLPPATLNDHLRQRTRVTRGHLRIKKKRGYQVGSLRPAIRFKALQQYVATETPDFTALVLMLLLEIWVLGAALFQCGLRGSETGVWQRIHSAKQTFPKAIHTRILQGP